MNPGDERASDTTILNSPCGRIYISCIYSEDEEYIERVLISLGKAGGCTRVHLSVLSEYINQALSMGITRTIQSLTKLTGLMCSEGISCVNIAAQYVLDRILDEYSNDEEGGEEEDD